LERRRIEATGKGNTGCLHKEGEDFPHGKDNPFCPFCKERETRGATGGTDADGQAAQDLVQVFSRPKPPTPPVPDDLMPEVGRKAGAYVEEFLKPQFIKPPPKNWRWNYIIDIQGRLRVERRGAARSQAGYGVVPQRRGRSNLVIQRVGLLLGSQGWPATCGTVTVARINQG
jgi:hypothetical protein